MDSEALGSERHRRVDSVEIRTVDTGVDMRKDTNRWRRWLGQNAGLGGVAASAIQRGLEQILEIVECALGFGH